MSDFAGQILLRRAVPIISAASGPIRFKIAENVLLGVFHETVYAICDTWLAYGDNVIARS